MTITPVTSLTEFRNLIQSGKYVVFDFWATWCGPCRVISPVFEALSKEYPSVEFYNVDIDEQADIAEEVGIRVVPTFMLFKDGKEVQSLKGAVPENLKKLLAQAI